MVFTVEITAKDLKGKWLIYDNDKKETLDALIQLLDECGHCKEYKVHSSPVEQRK